MVKIRLKRVGKKKQPSYRVVVADSRSPRDGRIIESIGHYQPRVEPSEIVIDSERAVYWLSHGAQPSDSVRKLLQISGAWAEFTGEAPPAAPPTPQEARKKATAAASVTETPASPTQEGGEPEAPAGERPAHLPEAADQEAAAPESEPEEK
ncbi:MAG: 30S ribosomal protein S16 [Actinomycetota bacterium]